jgi:hypothetical protein
VNRGNPPIRTVAGSVCSGLRPGPRVSLSTQHKGLFSCFYTAGHKAQLGRLISETDDLFTKQMAKRDANSAGQSTVEGGVAKGEGPERKDKPCLCKLIRRSDVIWVPTGNKNALGQVEFRCRICGSTAGR